MLDEYRIEIEAAKPVLTELRDSLEIDKIKFEINQLEQKTFAADFWNDQELAQKTLQRLNDLKEKFDNFTLLEKKYDDLLTLIELCTETDDEELRTELLNEMKDFKKQLEKMKLQTLLSGKYDGRNAILTLHAGAGGTEAQDWVSMLLRMYTRWAEDKGYKVSILDMLPGDEAGIKSAAVLVEGPNAYGYLKSEKGVHRLVRISPFDAAGRRHTSFASVDVMPEIDDDIEIDIKPEDLKIDTFRSGGAGGQHVNKTESAVRITHIPTGTVVSCQNERSQQSNRNTAMKILRAKLFDIYQEEQQKELDKIRGSQKEIAWGSQIRSYIFHPYSLVKDHRTDVEVGNVQAVMDGELDEFINAYLKSIAR
ncbi:peptide chain release factor 2 [Tepidanaerobacter acetatoxydans]|uniref:peptide chain release factor 2 n=1 Tax=Tepidanaerobacter acetatoxydans TaxID=499229 RepID=UPI00020BFD10|nr:peptide chain release factor 2 [Tepidanaerobacter acetatoxydans]AEE91000.1 peptide chain release factor 2 [Tepidanaerobacter acetatoxydans Re1]